MTDKTQSSLDLAYLQINALGGTYREGEGLEYAYDHGFSDAIDQALDILKALGADTTG